MRREEKRRREGNMRREEKIKRVEERKGEIKAEETPRGSNSGLACTYFVR